MIKDYLEYREGIMDFKTWIGSTRFILNQLRASGCDYPEYQMYEAYICHLEGRDEEASEILKKYQNKEFSGDELELAGVYLYLCTLYRALQRQGSGSMADTESSYAESGQFPAAMDSSSDGRRL